MAWVLGSLAVVKDTRRTKLKSEDQPLAWVGVIP